MGADIDYSSVEPTIRKFKSCIVLKGDTIKKFAMSNGFNPSIFYQSLNGSIGMRQVFMNAIEDYILET